MKSNKNKVKHHLFSLILYLIWNTSHVALSSPWNYSSLKNKFYNTDFHNQEAGFLERPTFYNTKKIFHNHKCYYCLFQSGNYYYCLTMRALQISLRPVSPYVFGDEFGSSLDSESNPFLKSCNKDTDSNKVFTFSLTNSHKQLTRVQQDDNNFDQNAIKILRTNGHKYRTLKL